MKVSNRHKDLIVKVVNRIMGNDPLSVDGFPTGSTNVLNKLDVLVVHCYHDISLREVDHIVYFSRVELDGNKVWKPWNYQKDLKYI